MKARRCSGDNAPLAINCSEIASRPKTQSRARPSGLAVVSEPVPTDSFRAIRLSSSVKARADSFGCWSGGAGAPEQADSIIAATREDILKTVGPRMRRH